MNPHAESISDMTTVEHDRAANTIPSPQLYCWSVRREVWEYRSLYMVPLTVAAVSLLGYMFATLGRAFSVADPAMRRTILQDPFDFVASVILGAGFLLSIFYTLDTMQSERRDRSILFWKSLPVSDATTVIAKYSVALVWLPLFSFVVVVAAQLIMLTLNTLAMWVSGIDPGPLWTASFHDIWSLLVHLSTVHILWFAPLYGWLLLVSAWSRRMAFLWAGLPVLVLYALEKIIFKTSYFITWVRYRVSGPKGFDMFSDADTMAHHSVFSFFLTPGLWRGLIFAALCVIVAIRLRRYREPN